MYMCRVHLLPLPQRNAKGGCIGGVSSPLNLRFACISQIMYISASQHAGEDSPPYKAKLA